MSLGKRHHLKDREVKEVLKKATTTLRNINPRIFDKGVEVAKIPPRGEVYLIDGTPMFLGIGEEVVPTLLNKEALEKLPTLTVDRGAVPHLCNGADLMAPGIVKISGEFQAGEIVVVIDAVYAKPIALVKALHSSKEIAEKKQGKVANNIHYVGDIFWEAFKQVR